MRKKPFLKVAIMLTLSLLIIVSSMFSSISPLLTENNRALAADGTEQVKPNDSGGVINPQNPQEFEDSIISKTATYTGTPGEYFIDLKVQGKEKEIKEPTDIVIVYDNSNSMKTNDRVAIAKEAVTNFINQTLTADNDSIRIALVTYGTVVLDGRPNDVRSGGSRRTENYSYKTLTTNATALKNKIPTNIPSDRGRGDDGGTNIQQGLQVANQILNSSNAEHKIIVTVTDGAPTVSYENKVRKGNGTSFTYEGEKNHGTNTIAEAKGIQSNGIDMYSIGIELTGDAGATEDDVTYVMQHIASSPEQYYNADKANELVDILTGLAKGITGTINNGEVTDPMSEYVNLALTDGQFKRASNDQLTDGSYYLSAADPKFLTGVTVGYENNTITLGSLMLGKDQYINIRYKVNIDTDKDSFNGTDYFATNDTTTLNTNINDPDSPTREFIVPKVKGLTLDISGSKIWDDSGGEMNRPTEIELELYRTTGDRSDGTLVDTVTVTPDSNDEWKYDFGMKPAYSSIGEKYDYYIKEISVDGYTTTYSKETFDVTNTLIAEPKIELTKKSDVDTITEAGQKVTYTFEIKNTGNVTLNKVNLVDELEGISDITYISINDEEVVVDDVNGIVLNPGDVLVANANYKITQVDVDNGSVKNEATVYGTPPNVEEPIEAKDDVTIVGTQDSQLALEKKSDAKEVTEAGQVVTYNFKVTNNGNVTIKDIVLDDPMLDGTIELEKTTLAPGESITVSKKYTVTQSDIDNGNIHNIATVRGEDPKGGTPKDEDEDEVPVTQTPGIDLVKIADRNDLVVGEDINYTFTATNTGNVTLNKVNLVDELEGISDITYISVNGEEIEDIEAITLKPGDVLLANASYTVTQDDVDTGIVENKATVFGTPSNSEEPISDTDSVSVPQDVQGNLTLEKSSDTTEFTEAEQTIVYSFIITNNSNVTMKNVKLDDPMLGGAIELEKTTLAPGESITVSKEYTVTQDDLDNGEIKNIATVTGEDPRGNTSTDEDDVTVVGTQDSQLALEKTSDSKEVTEAGQVVTYNFKVTNNGNVTIKNIVLDDPMLGGTIELEKTTLAPGESITVSKEYTVTQEDLNNGEIINVATVTGETPGGETPEDEDEVTIPGKNSPNILLEKESDVKEVEKVGDVVNYTFTITNNGNVDLHRVILNDPMLGGNIELESTDLKVGESIKVSVQHKVTEEQLKYATITNKAIASGLSPKNELVYDVDDVVINTVLPIVVPKPEGEITKEVNGKGGYRVAENGETFAFDIKALLKEGQDIETLTILDEIDERLEIESVDVTIDEDTIIESSADDIKNLKSEKAELESNLTVFESELEALEATLAQTKEKEAEEVIEEPEVVEPTEDETTEEPEVVEPTEDETTEEPEVTEPVEEEEETEATAEESTEVETQEPVVEEEVTEPVEEQQEPATEESEEASEPKGAKPVNTEAIETAIEELKVQINELKAEIEDIDVQISELEANNIDLKAGSILEHGELVQNGQTVEFKVTNKEVLKALEGQTIKMTIKAKFKTIDDDALANGVENTATVTFGDKPKDTNTVVVYPIKKEEPTPEEPEIPEEPEEPVKPTPEPEEPEVPEKPESTPPPTKEEPKVTPPVEKAPETPAKPKVEEKEKLPETGEAHNTNYAGVIALALAGGFMLLISRRRKFER